MTSSAATMVPLDLPVRTRLIGANSDTVSSTEARARFPVPVRVVAATVAGFGACTATPLRLFRLPYEVFFLSAQ